MTDELQTDADRLRALIAKACLSQREFAREIGENYRDVNAWMAGKEPVPTVVMLAAEHLACCPMTEAARENR